MSRLNDYELENRIGDLTGIYLGLKLVEQNSTKNYKVFEDKLGNNYLFSYETFIIAFDKYKNILGFSKYWGYSATTIRHQSTFIRDYGRYNYKEYKERYIERYECGACSDLIMEDLVFEIKAIYEYKKGGE